VYLYTDMGHWNVLSELWRFRHKKCHQGCRRRLRPAVTRTSQIDHEMIPKWSQIEEEQHAQSKTFLSIFRKATTRILSRYSYTVECEESLGNMKNIPRLVHKLSSQRGPPKSSRKYVQNTFRYKENRKDIWRRRRQRRRQREIWWRHQKRRFHWQHLAKILAILLSHLSPTPRTSTIT